MEDDVKPLFVGNLDRSVDQRQLQDLFEDEGFKVVKLDLKSGFAFVFLASGAEEAARALDGKELYRKPIKIEVARGDGAVKRREDQRRKNTENEPSESLFVVNFDSFRTTERDLERAFETFGRIMRVQKMSNYAFIQFETVEQATEAKLALNGKRIKDRDITVEYVDKRGRAERDRDRDRYRDTGRRERSRSPRRRSRSPPPPRRRSPPRYKSRSRSRSPRRDGSRSPGGRNNGRGRERERER